MNCVFTSALIPVAKLAKMINHLTVCFSSALWSIKCFFFGSAAHSFGFSPLSAVEFGDTPGGSLQQKKVLMNLLLHGTNDI